MESQAQTIAQWIEKQPEDKILTANQIYAQMPKDISEATFYQALTRMVKRKKLCHLTKGLYYRPRRSRFGLIPLGETTIVQHYTDNKQGMVIGYRLYQQLGITTQISKNVEILSNAVQDNKKTIQNVKVNRLELRFTEPIRYAIATLELLQNYSKIEDINRRSMAKYMKRFAENYSEEAVKTVLKKRRYKKSTIAFLAMFLTFWKVKHTLHEYLSALSVYAIPRMEEFYESA
ncbi:DUF6088 family protein [Schwartzia succinivorans]|jgi:hypothetical protein|uniref:Transcriptional regulator, AbiEi antitoxin, Type IV TA system n=1 Tax=Schwartzia succinivorans DSM 10502 TaxID=1123243 RepID=A0A1M4UII4_9FIRM|nr:DUF6088 family protein [Schwartzia succinivorans]SHE56546.1 hypothetical protein SAMN02745190_00674 [Schwartzia succinivorans DSM 10502]